MYSMLYIICKLFCAAFKNVKMMVICWTHRFLWRFFIWAVQMTIFIKNIQNWSCDALFHSKSSAYDDAIGFVPKFHSWRHLASNVEFHSWRHLASNVDSWNSCLMLVSGRLFKRLNRIVIFWNVKSWSYLELYFVIGWIQS